MPLDTYETYSLDPEQLEKIEKILKIRFCVRCDKQFKPNGKIIYCSEGCRSQTQLDQYKNIFPKPRRHHRDQLNDGNSIFQDHGIPTSKVNPIILQKAEENERISYARNEALALKFLSERQELDDTVEELKKGSYVTLNNAIGDVPAGTVGRVVNVGTKRTPNRTFVRVSGAEKPLSLPTEKNSMNLSVIANNQKVNKKVPNKRI